MKRIISITIIMSTLIFGSCLGDLDTKPLNENDFTEKEAYSTPESYLQGLAKIYGAFVLVGQSGTGSAEISVADAGASELNRAFWNVQEVSTDAAKASTISDAWVKEMNTNTWTSKKNDAIYAVYARTILTATLANEYLKQTSAGRLDERGVDATLRAEIQKYRAEARYMRAYVYWMAMDVFGQIPFVTENDPIGAFEPKMIARADLFKYIESELIELSNSADMREGRTAVYPSVDKGAVWGLLARLYINGEVYTGEAKWAQAKGAAEKVIGMGYELANVYAHMFMGDNGQNPNVRNEFIFAVDYHSDKIGSWGGTTYLINGALASGDSEKTTLTGSDGWGSIRSSYEYAQKFGVSNPNYTTGSFDCDDKRAMFYIKGRQESMDDMGDVMMGWACVKYSKHLSTGDLPAPIPSYSATDMPMIRLAEIYLIYAEATLRAAGTSSNDATSLGYLNKLRDRAFDSHTPLTGFDQNYLIDERARELMWEGHRRTDLVRFGLYTTGTYLWAWKGGVKDGAALAKRYLLCPLDQEDVNGNSNLKQNEGY